MNQDERNRRHEERWQKEVLDGMARMMSVLHDISDHLQLLHRVVSRQTPPPPAERARTSEEPMFYSVPELAEHLGIGTTTLWAMHHQHRGPTATRLGRRVLFRRDDVEEWLDEQRDVAPTAQTAWRAAHLPGKIGSGFSSTSTPPGRTVCAGSGDEPMAASTYSGRAVCRICRDHVLVNKNGRLRKHYPL